MTDLPDRFVVRYSGWIRTFEARVTRENGEWLMESELFLPLIGSVILTAPRPVDEEHARHVYEAYKVVDEDWPNT